MSHDFAETCASQVVGDHRVGQKAAFAGQADVPVRLFQESVSKVAREVFGRQLQEVDHGDLAVAHIQAGGGTVADAKPAYEYEESVAKSRAAMRAIQLACRQVDWP